MLKCLQVYNLYFQDGILYYFTDFNYVSQESREYNYNIKGIVSVNRELCVFISKISSNCRKTRIQLQYKLNTGSRFTYFSTVKPLISHTSKEFFKCRSLHFLKMECCRYLVF